MSVRECCDRSYRVWMKNMYGDAGWTYCKDRAKHEGIIVDGGITRVRWKDVQRRRNGE